MANNSKAGPITLAVGLIFFGGILFVANVNGMGILETAIKYWPLLLIGLGLEYFAKSYIYRKNADQSGDASFHLPTVVIILLVTFIGYAGQQVTTLVNSADLKGLISEAVAGTNFNYRHDLESESLAVKPGAKINVNNKQGIVELVPSTDDKLHVQATVVAWGAAREVAEQRAKQVKVKIAAGEVIDITCNPEQNHNNKRPTEITLRVSVPKGVNLNIVNRFGTLRGDNLEANLEIRAENGETAVSGVKGNVLLNGENGQAALEKIDGTVDVRMNSGNIRLNDISGNIRARNEHGELEVASTQPVSANYNISNRNGETILRIPETSNATITANTRRGMITGSLNLKLEKANSDPEKSSQHTSGEEGAGSKVSAVLGTGKGAINLYSENGNIIVDKN